jgi:hypothetical protein
LRRMTCYIVVSLTFIGQALREPEGCSRFAYDRSSASRFKSVHISAKRERSCRCCRCYERRAGAQKLPCQSHIDDRQTERSGSLSERPWSNGCYQVSGRIDLDSLKARSYCMSRRPGRSAGSVDVESTRSGWSCERHEITGDRLKLIIGIARMADSARRGSTVNHCR